MNVNIAKALHTPTSKEGCAYVKTVLDPCGENTPIEFTGIPDGGETDIVLLSPRDDLVLSPPSFLSTNDTWGIIIFDTPYLVAQQIMVRYGAVAPSEASVRQYLNGISQVRPPWFPLWLRPTVQCVENFINRNHPTVNFPVNTLADFEVSFMRPATLTTFGLTPDAPGWATIRKFRCAKKGRTLHLNAPATATQGRVVSAQIGTESSAKILMQNPDATVGDVQTAYPARFTVTPPFQFNTLAQQDLNARQDVIKKGSYDMQRHWGGAILWNEVEDVRPIWRANISNLAATWRIPSGYINELGVNVNTQELMKYDGFDVNLGWVVTHIDGLSNQATIHMKCRSTWELNVPGTSPWAGMKKAPCASDPGALCLEKLIGPTIPHSYEAQYNDIGLLADMLGKLIPAVGNVALKGLGSIFLGRNRGSRGNNQSIQDPYSGPGLYGDSGFVSNKPRKRR